MKKLFIVLFLNCFILSITLAKGAGNDANVPQKSAQSSSVTVQHRESNEPNMIQRLEVVRQKLAKNRRPEEINQPAAEQRRTRARHHAARQQESETQLADEFQKHNQRIAILSRIRQLAEQEKLADTIERVDGLIKMENDRHMKKIAPRPHRRPVAAGETNLPRRGAGLAGEPNN
jgi:uncharacterized protein YaiL (DUF2058 family)